MYVLLFIAIASHTPAQLGTFKDEQACQTAIRTIYETRYTPRGVELNAAIKAAIQTAVDIDLKFQREYTCVPYAIDYN